MALIKCPECGKEISDKSEVCIHCGFPIKKQRVVIVNGKEFDREIFEKFLRGELNILQVVNPLCDAADAHAGILFDKMVEIRETKQIPDVINTPPSIAIKDPTCPMCNSTNLEKITAPKRIFSAGIFGLGSDKIGKSFECKNCGYKW